MFQPSVHFDKKNNIHTTSALNYTKYIKNTHIIYIRENVIFIL
jgi:hypothetical protein